MIFSIVHLWRFQDFKNCRIIISLILMNGRIKSLPQKRMGGFIFGIQSKEFPSLFKGAAAGGPTSHLGLSSHHHNSTAHPALTPHQPFGSSVSSNGGSNPDREALEDKKHLAGKILALFSFFSFG